MADLQQYMGVQCSLGGKGEALKSMTICLVCQRAQITGDQHIVVYVRLQSIVQPILTLRPHGDGQHGGGVSQGMISSRGCGGDGVCQSDWHPLGTLLEQHFCALSVGYLCPPYQPKAFSGFNKELQAYICAEYRRWNLWDERGTLGRNQRWEGFSRQKCRKSDVLNMRL